MLLLKDFYLQCKIETEMTTAGVKNDQLPNNRLEVFKSNTKLVKASDGLFNCSLKLSNGSSMIILMREDGMINATMLCKAHGKKLLADYNRNKQTKEYLEELSVNMGIPIIELFVTTQGKYGGTWVHRKVAIHLAQWLSPSFAVQVSNWIDELTLVLEEKNKVLESKDKEIKTLIEETKQFQDSLTTKQQNKTNFEQSSDIVEFKLTLKNNTELSIPVSKDGYINVTKLCKAGGKEYKHWKANKESEAVINAIERSVGIPADLIIRDIRTGKNESRGTFVHRRLALIIAQWISPDFAVQVAAWTEELLLFGKVELGQEKTNKELEEKFNQKIQSLQQTIETVVNENLKIKSTYSHLAELNDKLRMKRNYHKFKKGNCLYIITDRWREKEYLKIGYTDNINTRLQTYRTSMPNVKIEFLLYLTENKVLEKCLKLRYASKLIQKNHEYVIDATVEQLVKSINTLTKYLSIEATEETKLSLYNEPYQIYNLVFLDQNGNVEDNTDPIELDSPDEENNNEHETDHDSEVYKCDICGTEYKTKGRLLNHMIKLHNIQKDDGKTCPICKKVFRDRGKRNRHERSVHEKSSKVKCTECDKDFSSNDALMNHIRNVHKKSEQCKCAQCGKVCSNPGNLRKHIAQMHDKTTSVSCHICDNIFTSQCNLTQHILKVHERKEKCNCQLCGKELLSVLGLEYHMRNVHKI